MVARLRASGAGARATEAVVDTALRGGSDLDVLAAADGAVSLDVLLGLRAAAEQSFVDSTRLAFVGGALLLTACAAVCARTLGARAQR